MLIALDITVKEQRKDRKRVLELSGEASSRAQFLINSIIMIIEVQCSTWLSLQLTGLPCDVGDPQNIGGSSDAMIYFGFCMKKKKRSLEKWTSCSNWVLGVICLLYMGYEIEIYICEFYICKIFICETHYNVCLTLECLFASIIFTWVNDMGFRFFFFFFFLCFSYVLKN